jgi:hypothetical protein
MLTRSFALVFSVATFLALVALSTAQNEDPMANIQLGMQGLMQTGKDPALLAQLMKDLQVRYL